MVATLRSGLIAWEQQRRASVIDSFDMAVGVTAVSLAWLAGVHAYAYMHDHWSLFATWIVTASGVGALMLAVRPWAANFNQSDHTLFFGMLALLIAIPAAAGAYPAQNKSARLIAALDFEKGACQTKEVGVNSNALQKIVCTPSADRYPEMHKVTYWQYPSVRALRIEWGDVVEAVEKDWRRVPAGHTVGPDEFKTYPWPQTLDEANHRGKVALFNRSSSDSVEAVIYDAESRLMARAIFRGQKQTDVPFPD